MIDTYSTYESDKKLFKHLGLTVAKNVPNWETVQLGIVETDNYSIKLSVMGCSAQFYTAEITRKDTNDYLEVTTGSGELSNFWSSIELIAQGMLGIKTL